MNIFFKNRFFLYLASLKWFILSLFILIVTSLLLIHTKQALSLVDSKITSTNQANKLPNLLDEKPQREEIKTDILSNNTPVPNFSSGAVYAIDLDLNQPLYQKNIDKKLSPASTTKIMTALVSIEQFQPTDVLTISKEALVGGSSMGLQVGEKITFRSLLYGMLLNSGNDAAYAIALNYPGGFDAFIKQMNEKSKALGLINTNFTNPAGFDDPKHFSSAFDLSLIAKEAIKNPQISRIVATKETLVESRDSSKTHTLKNLNKLLSEQGFLGIKTGFTEKSGENFVGLLDKNGHKILTVVLNSEDRFGETKQLVDWIFQNYTWQPKSSFVDASL